MTYEQRTAELALHGWRPVRVAQGWGIILDGMQEGFYTRPSLLRDMTTGLEVLAPVRRFTIHSGECAWCDIPEEALELMEERLATA